LRNKELQVLLSKLNMMNRFTTPKLDAWRAMAKSVDDLAAQGKKMEVVIALVGKYTGLQDSYLSVIKALKHAAMHVDRSLVIEWIEASDLLKLPADASTKTKAELHAHAEKHVDAWQRLKSANGIICPGGFGGRGVEGKIKAAEYARTHKVPYLGVCLGMQVAVIEYCKHVLGWSNAQSEEYADKSGEDEEQKKDKRDNVIVFMPEIDREKMGGTMRLGARETKIVRKGEFMSHRLYQGDLLKHSNGDIGVMERHRHRYEVNPEIIEDVEKAGLLFVGMDDKKERMEIVELPRSEHPFYYATQYHPEFKTHPGKPSPPFHGLLLAATNQLDEYLKEVDELVDQNA